MSNYSCLEFSAEGKPLSKKALKKQQKEEEKAKRKAEVAAKLVSCLQCQIVLEEGVIKGILFVNEERP